METEQLPQYHPDMSEFQKDLVVWKHGAIMQNYTKRQYVSEGLSSVETHSRLEYCPSKRFVSEGLSSVETKT